MRNRLVSGLEPAVAAQQPSSVFRVGSVAYAGAICADFNYPDLIRQAGAADIVFAPVADWPGLRHRHARMAVARAAENGFALFRIAGQSKSSLTTAYGEEVRSQCPLAAEVKLFVATTLVQKVWTPYRAWVVCPAVPRRLARADHRRPPASRRLSLGGLPFRLNSLPLIPHSRLGEDIG